ncbi:hypothetical protein A1OQ_04240 [Enterovibrio norvegicus FF-162]|uniref:hypothetical protein n=1 Tax=Enterovibrio norvegicus TaxID=188144 RepID=UPI0003703126|nr:hypothetical protein [Enterovibrio norvegicus]OEE82257.1 hypothetical protein A1OQ_04240 [Enterovibrio norvegicus FF-162]
MAAEKLTTARLIQILVVMAVLIAAFVWRTIDYSSSKNTLTCTMLADECQVSLKGEKVHIQYDKQGDAGGSVVVFSPATPSSLQVNLDSDNSVLIAHEVIVMGNKRAYIYALPDSVKYGAAHKFILHIDQDQIEINF